MKAFWVVLLVLIVGAVAYLALGRGGGAPASKIETPAPAEIQPLPPRAPGQKDNDESAFFVGDPTEPAAPKMAEPEAPKVAAEPPPAPKAAPLPEPDATTKPPAPAPAVEVPKPEAPKPEVPKPEAKKSEEPKAAAPAAPNPAPAAPAPSPKPASSPVVFGDDAKIVKNDDGSMMIDEKYPLKGEGTKEKPYQITWEYLVSAQEDYQPRLGKKKLPGRMKLITGKYVKITGFVAFPIMATEPTEMLAMLNQWDGCCIGIPPTPYDAIEVKLKDAASNEQRLTTFGTVEGKLTVEPYLVRDWLVSLYSMDEARMERAQ